MADAGWLVLAVAGPLVLLTLTSFVKFSVVLGLLRSGLGTPDVPNGAVIAGVALLMSLFVMAPVADQVLDAVAPVGGAAHGGAAEPGAMPPGAGTTQPEAAASRGGAAGTTQPEAAAARGAGDAAASGAAGVAGPGAARAWPQTDGQWLSAAERAAAPVRAFLARHVHPDDQATFDQLAEQLRGEPVADDGLAVLAPAFVTSELTEAFMIGVLLLLPFLVIDLAVGLTLSALGVTTSPTLVALPLKLLLFLVVDGWRLLVDGLVRGYV